MLATLSKMQQSFNLMLSCQKKEFTGRLSCTYNRPYRLIGCWEAKLISFTHTIVPVYIVCDLMEYSEVNQSKIQLLDYFYSPKGIKSEGQTPYVKVLHKRFNTINIDVVHRLLAVATEGEGEQQQEQFDDSDKDLVIKKIFGDNSGEVTCLIHFRRIG